MEDPGLEAAWISLSETAAVIMEIPTQTAQGQETWVKLQKHLNPLTRVEFERWTPPKQLIDEVNKFSRSPVQKYVQLLRKNWHLKGKKMSNYPK